MGENRASGREAGNPVKFRIVSETNGSPYESGLGARVVGVSHSCDHPQARGLPVLTRSIVNSAAAQAQIDRAVSDAVQPVTHAPSVLTLEWAEPPFYGGHWVPQQAERVGGVNVLGAAGTDSGRASWTQIESLQPDVTVVMCCGYGLGDDVAFARALDPQRPLGQVWAVDANALFSRRSLGVVRGAEVLAALAARRGHPRPERTHLAVKDGRGIRIRQESPGDRFRSGPGCRPYWPRARHPAPRGCGNCPAPMPARPALLSTAPAGRDGWRRMPRPH